MTRDCHNIFNTDITLDRGNQVVIRLYRAYTIVLLKKVIEKRLLLRIVMLI